MLTATAEPTNAEIEAMCDSTACHTLIADILALDPPDCDLTIPTSGLVLNVYEYADSFSGKCLQVLLGTL
ncbi:hypothetical protein BBJ28_00016264 [Nothophytophthora sp. Chile5]|nr:hypothetical protein BBJ28_00016264 [Nothophytophthora sp. Chile5]